MVIAANKSDIPRNKALDIELIEKDLPWYTEMGGKLFTMSTRTGDGIHEVLNYLMKDRPAYRPTPTPLREDTREDEMSNTSPYW
jgi:hypothetical protein